MKKILFVDDDPFILKALELSFSGKQYETFFCSDGMSALELLEEQSIDLILSDMQMPGIKGYELLQRVKSAYPNVIRVILAGSADEKNVIKALQNNIAKVYLFKPWENRVLYELIENLFKTEDILATNNVLSIINNADELPTIKSSYKAILDLTENDAGIDEITDAIEHDPSITSKLLHIANSAFYGLRTASITQAVKYLGYSTIRNLVLSTPIIDSMQLSGQSALFIEKQWNHAFLTNKILYYIYGKYLHKSIAEVEGTAGLLHNVGIVFLIKHFQKDYIKLIQTAGEKKNFTEMEKETIKVTHSEAGGYLLNWWELPYPVVEAALFHHEPFDERIINKELVMAVHLSQYHAYNVLQYSNPDKFYPEIYDALKIDEDKLEKDIASVKW